VPEGKPRSGTVLSFELKKKAISVSWKSLNKKENSNDNDQINSKT
jgi:hypothetical protein